MKRAPQAGQTQLPALAGLLAQPVPVAIAITTVLDDSSYGSKDISLWSRRQILCMDKPARHFRSQGGWRSRGRGKNTQSSFTERAVCARRHGVRQKSHGPAAVGV